MPGDAAFCLHCGNPNIMTEDRSWRKSTEEEERELSQNEDAIKVRLTVQRAIELTKPGVPRVDSPWRQEDQG